jgi:hypothetical protein
MRFIQKIICSLYKKNYNKAANYPSLQKNLDFLFHQLVDEKKQIQILFYRSLGFYNSFNNPKTFNEKIQWLKINDRSELHTLCADKLLVREYIKEQIGEKYLIPLLYKTQNVYDLNINQPKIKEPCIIKTNHDSGTFVIIKDSKEELDWGKIQKKLKKSLTRNYYFRWFEWQYKNIKPYVIIEKLLQDSNGKIPVDYKFHCFEGKVEYIQVDIDRDTNHRRNIYDPNWNLCNFIIDCKNGEPQSKPENLDKMMEIASKLASKFSYVRIDLYNVNNVIYFGEITFHSTSGHQPFIPKYYDKYWGDKINLNSSLIKNL